MATCEMKAIRDGFGAGLVEAGWLDNRVVALSADLRESVKMSEFIKQFPERYIEAGVAEQNMAVVASGLASYGKIPFIASFAVFNPGRNWEQIRTTVCLNDMPVKIIGSHAGVGVGEDGGSHQALEDIALMRVLPNMTVIVPADAEEARKATLAIAKTLKPAYLRVARQKSALFTTSESPFEIGKAEVLWSTDKPDAVIIACGTLVFESIMAAERLASEGVFVTVINNHTIKPLDSETLISEITMAGAVVTAEDHQVAGGLGGAVAELVAEYCPVPVEFVGVRNRFGQSGEAGVLAEEYGLTRESIITAVKKVIARKKK